MIRRLNQVRNEVNEWMTIWAGINAPEHCLTNNNGSDPTWARRTEKGRIVYRKVSAK